MPLAGARETFAAFLVAAVLIGATLWRAPPEPPQADALRYLDYSVNLLESGTFGLSPAGAGLQVLPGRANTPLYPALLSGVFRTAGVTPADLRCYLITPPQDCAAVLRPVYAVQVVVAALGIACIWQLGFCLIGTRAGATLAAACALLSGQAQAFAGQLLTENLSLMLFALFTLALVQARAGSAFWSTGAGLALGLLTLTRPEFLYLALAVSALAAFVAFVAAARGRQAWRAALALIAALTLVVTPWLWRNQATFGDPALTATYGGQTLAQRVQYNRMSPTELGASVIYWLPDFGDSLARRVLPEDSYRRLGFGPGSYYSAGPAYHAALAQARGGDAAATAALLADDVLAHPFKHALVTLALAWRGLFVAKLWGLVGLIAFVVACVRWPAGRAALAVVSAPAWFMLALYAAVSVSIPRYAICFVPTFALAQAYCVARLAHLGRVA